MTHPFALALGLTLLSIEAAACPLCDTPTGQAVRDGIFDRQFFARAAAVLAPFPILAGVVAFIHCGGRRGGSGAAGPEANR